MYVYIYIYIHLYIHRYICIHTHTHTQIHTYTDSHMPHFGGVVVAALARRTVRDVIAVRWVRGVAAIANPADKCVCVCVHACVYVCVCVHVCV